MNQDQTLQSYINYLVKWLQQSVKLAQAQGLIVGISGGIDSAVAGALIKRAFPNQSLGLIMPIESMWDLSDAQQVVKHLNLNTQTINLTKTFKSLVKITKVKTQTSLINIKPRLRMTTLYALAQENNYLVVGTDNAAEWLLGYFTKYGDGGADLLPLIHLTKTQVRQIAHWLGLPENIINKVPSAGLFKGQTDESELGFSYEMIDKYLTNQPIPTTIKQKIQAQHLKTMHKRQPILTPKPLK